MSTPVRPPIVQALQPHDPRQVGPYRVLGVLGAGGMGQVYLATGPTGPVAVKVVHPGLAPDAQFRVRFAREAAAGRRVHGPWTAAVLAADPDADAPWLATEYLPGVGLNRAVSACGPLPPSAVVTLATQLAHALVDIHAAGLVHRDVKPGNVMLTAERACLIDFGISRALDGTRMTGTGLTVGTPAFMSPEQAAGADLSTASDLFSLGAVLVWAATGQGPFGDGTPVALLRRILATEPSLGALSGPVRELAATCLRRDPAARPTAAQLAAQLTRLTGRPAGPAPGWLPPEVAALVPDPARLPTVAAAPTLAAPPSHPSWTPVPPRPWTPPGAVAPGFTGPGSAKPGAVSRRRILFGLGAVLGTAAVGGVGAAAAGLLGPGSNLPLPDLGGPDTPGTPARAARWTYPTGGRVGGLAAGDGVVYAVGADATAHAIDARTGAERWTYTLRAESRTNPVVVDGAVYVDDDTLGIYAFDAGGALRWETDGRLITAGGGAVLASTSGAQVRDQITGLDAATGAVRWNSAVEGALGGGFALDNPGATTDGRGHVGLHDAVRTVDLATGATLWEQPLPELKTVIAAGALVLAGGGRPTGDDDLVAFDAATGQERWRRTVEDSFGEPTVHDGTVYVDAGNGAGLTALDAATGQPRWQTEQGPITRAMLGTTPVVSGDTCYVGGVRIGGLDATPAFTLFAHATDTGDLRWALDLDFDTGYTARIAVVGDTVVLGSEQFNAPTGTVIGIA